MSGRSDDERDWDRERERVIGLGERSFHRTYYPELQRRLEELEYTSRLTAGLSRIVREVFTGPGALDDRLGRLAHGVVSVFGAYAADVWAESEGGRCRLRARARSAEPAERSANAVARSWPLVAEDSGHAGVLVAWFGRDLTAEEEGLLESVADAASQVVRIARAEEALCLSEERHRRVLDATPAAMHLYELRDDGSLVFVGSNPAADRILTTDCSRFVGLTVEEAFPPLAETEVPARYREAARHGTSWHTEQIIYEGGGIRGAYEVYAFQTQPGECAAMFLDITDRKRAEEALRDSEQRMELALLGGDLGTWDWDVVTGEVLFNERWCAMLGYDLSELEPSVHTWERLLCPEDAPRVMEALEAHLRGDSESYDVECRLLHKSGEWVWVLDKGRVIRRDTDGAPLRACGTHLDITARKLADEERQKLEAQLRQAQKMEAIGHLAGGVAHDFNNLLQAILGYGDMALDEVEEGSLAREHLREILKAGSRAATLVTQLLAFSRRQVLRMEHVDLNEVVADLMKMLRRVIGEHVTIEFSPGYGLGAVLADRGQLEQILVNLCVNARDAMPAGGRLTIETSVAVIGDEYRETHPWARSGEYSVVSVTDTGCGMDHHTLASAFEPFFTTKEVGHGTGLGLSTVYGLVKQHQGMVHAYSEVGLGTTMKVYLPRVEAEATERPVAERAVAGGTETVLLAEDDQTVRRLSSTILETAGYTVVMATDGEEALRAFEERFAEIDLVVLDVMMPKLGGRAVLERMRERKPEVRAVLASGYSMSALPAGLVLEDDVPLVQKPATRNELLRAVRKALDAG